MTCLRIHPFTGDLSLQGMDHERAYSCTYPSDKRSRHGHQRQPLAGIEFLMDSLRPWI
jgi:hypothetical protein